MPASLVYEKYPGYQLPKSFNIFSCPSCNTSFCDPQDQEHEIYNLIYKNGSEVRWYDRYWRYAKQVKLESKPLDYLAESEDTYWGVRESIKKIVKEKGKNIKILEIGCGLGYLTYSLNKEGLNCLGLDISSEAVKEAKTNFGDHYIAGDVHEFAITNENKFDVIIFTELIEHITDVFSFISSLKSLLNFDGKIILTTPNKSFFPLETVWATDLPPVHYWWFSEDSIKYIAKKLSLKTSFIDFSKFYSNNPKLIDFNQIPIPMTPPVFDEDGSILDYNITNSKSGNSLVQKLKKFISSTVFIFLIQYLRAKMNRNLSLPGKRGLVICVILEK
jgi:SAM-dependent methyltransferase